MESNRVSSHGLLSAIVCLGATWYNGNQQSAGMSSSIAQGVLHETIQAASELTLEAKAATTMGTASLQGKAERNRRAAEE